MRVGDENNAGAAALGRFLSNLARVQPVPAARRLQGGPCGMWALWSRWQRVSEGVRHLGGREVVALPRTGCGKAEPRRISAGPSVKSSRAERADVTWRLSQRPLGGPWFGAGGISCRPRGEDVACHLTPAFAPVLRELPDEKPPGCGSTSKETSVKLAQGSGFLRYCRF